MFDSFKESMRRRQESRERTQRDRQRQEQARQADADRAEAMAQDRSRRMRAIRVITGDVKYRYAIIDTIRAVGHYEAYAGQLIDPDESTRRAIEQIQGQAFSIGADAVIHAQFHVVRYTIQRRQLLFTPVYETHLFGTAIKILGPPEDWGKEDGA